MALTLTGAGSTTGHPPPPPPSSNWILATGFWADTGVWDDTATWDGSVSAGDERTLINDMINQIQTILDLF